MMIRSTGLLFLSAVSPNLADVLLPNLDYPNKTIGFGPSFIPTGDLQADFAHIRSFYADKAGKFPDKQGAIELRPSNA